MVKGAGFWAFRDQVLALAASLRVVTAGLSVLGSGGRRGMRTIAFIIRKEFQQIFRDRRLLPLIFISPVLQIVLLGYAANMDVKDIPLAICDQDRERGKPPAWWPASSSPGASLPARALAGRGRRGAQHRAGSLFACPGHPAGVRPLPVGGGECRACSFLPTARNRSPPPSDSPMPP